MQANDIRIPQIQYRLGDYVVILRRWMRTLLISEGGEVIITKQNGYADGEHAMLVFSIKIADRHGKPLAKPKPTKAPQPAAYARPMSRPKTASRAPGLSPDERTRLRREEKELRSRQHNIFMTLPIALGGLTEDHPEMVHILRYVVDFFEQFESVQRVEHCPCKTPAGVLMNEYGFKITWHKGMLPTCADVRIKWEDLKFFIIEGYMPFTFRIKRDLRETLNLQDCCYRKHCEATPCPAYSKPRA